MTRLTPFILIAFLSGADGLTAFAPAAQNTTARSKVAVSVPQNDAELTVDGKPLEGSGAVRTFETSPGTKGAAGKLTVKATWKPNAYTEMTRTRTVSFRTGEPVTIDLRVDDPTDRVRVDYVPTAQEVAEEMVKLAGVTSNDVVFEPGCGDARIVIAAVKAGAKRGVGIDIAEDRVIESRENVKAAGLADRIEIRLGDALDIRDLSDASVVLLYMGDHFNMLMRPQLWKHLKVGSRVVSHRFLMGDWKPDKTISVGGLEGWDYQLHLWTITEDVKRRVE